MIKRIYFSHIFSVVTLLIFIPSMKFDGITVTLFIVSTLLNMISLYILMFKKITIYKSKFWFFCNGLINASFICLMLYTAFITYLLMYG
jgi:O-antigen/teichoic acid export membrane protein